jgi:hypothetical protein
MRSQRITFLSNILEYNISNGCQLMIANEYYSANDLPIIYNHDEDGLAELCNGMSANEILRASSYGNYSYTEPYVFINAHGNLETSDEVCCNWRTIAEWMIDGGYENAFDAWNILNNTSYVDVGDFETDFLDEFPYYVLIDDDKAQEWYDYADYTLSYLLLTSWEDLKDEYDIWKNEKEEELEKTMKRCGDC